MRREALYLEDICAAADAIGRFIAGLDETGFRDSEIVGSAVVQKLSVIGEAASRISMDLRSRHPEIPWPEIIAFRNILVHAYFGIDWGVVWLAASSEVPLLRTQVVGVLQTEFGSSTG